MEVSWNRGTPKSSILIGCAIKNHLFWGTTIYGNPHIKPYLYNMKYRILSHDIAMNNHHYSWITPIYNSYIISYCVYTFLMVKQMLNHNFPTNQALNQPLPCTPFSYRDTIAMPQCVGSMVGCCIARQRILGWISASGNVTSTTIVLLTNKNHETCGSKMF